MRRRDFIKVVVGSAGAWSFAARAQPGGMRRIGFVTALAQADPFTIRYVEALRGSLEKLGWIEGQNVQFTYRYATHHADDPAEILCNVARFVPPGAPVIIGEFHPEGPCSEGPPRNHRLAPEKIQEWCESAGLAVVGYQRQSPEHYVVVARRDR